MSDAFDTVRAAVGLKVMVGVVESLSVAYIACKFAADHVDQLKLWANNEMGATTTATTQAMQDDLNEAATLLHRFHEQMVRALATGNAGLVELDEEEGDEPEYSKVTQTLL